MKKPIMMILMSITGVIILIILLSIKSAHLLIIPNHEERSEVKPKTPLSGTINVHYMTSNPLHSESALVTQTTIAAVGDVLIHDRVYNIAKTASGQYDFKPFLKPVKSLMEQPDLLIANSESKIGGQALGLSSYPTFNSPYAVGDALKADGVDLVTMANNHALDRGEASTRSAIHHWNQIGMPYTGVFVSKKDQDHLRILTKHGISFAFLAYTYGTNGIPLPRGKSYLVNLIDLNKIKHDIHKAKTKADVVVVSLHFGTEYDRMPDSYQKDVANAVANDGADIIFGSHPHVLQPVKWIKRKDGKNTFVAYSLGNFFSGQTGDYKDIGGMAELTVTKQVENGHKVITLSHPTFTPTFVTSDYVVYPLEDLPDHKFQYTQIQSHMNQWLKNLSFTNPTQTPTTKMNKKKHLAHGK